jgi:hypothetical protein
MKDKQKISLAGAVVVGSLLGCLGGSGGTDGGAATSPGYRDDIFVSDDSTTGTISLKVTDDDLAVGETSGFRVEVKNAAGQPVPNMSVVCDSENGVALIEPVSGRELTDSQGVMSGRIGCERPGSFQMVCRLTVGANRRKFAGVRCSGSGAVDFPSSGGGSLGGGVSGGSDGAARVTQTSLIDDPAGDSTNNQVDVLMTTNCDGDATTSDPEPFTDTFVKVKLENNFEEKVTFTHLSFSLDNVDGVGTGFTSRRTGITAVAAASGGTVEVEAPIFRAFGTGKYVGHPGGTSTQIGAVGFRTVTVTVYGETESGKDVELTSRLTAVFGTYNRCS